MDTDRPPGEEKSGESWGYDLVLYGNEQMIQGSDNVTLVAFAALAFQQIRGKGELHHSLGCGMLLISVLLCAIVHFTIGNAYVSRGRKMIKGTERRRNQFSRRFFLGVALTAAVTQFLLVIIGVGLILLPDTPPAWLNDYVLRYFGAGAPRAAPVPAP